MKRYLLIASCLVLAGCTTVGPDYHLPEQAAMQRPAAQGRFANADGQLASAQAVSGRWWQLYLDPVLNQATNNRVLEQLLAGDTLQAISELGQGDIHRRLAKPVGRLTIGLKAGTQQPSQTGGASRTASSFQPREVWRG